MDAEGFVPVLAEKKHLHVPQLMGLGEWSTNVEESPPRTDYVFHAFKPDSGRPRFPIAVFPIWEEPEALALASCEI